MNFKQAAKQEEEISHPSASMTDYFPEDTLLRAKKFSIHSRPKRGEACWTRRGKVYFQSIALRMARSEIKK